MFLGDGDLLFSVVGLSGMAPEIHLVHEVQPPSHFVRNTTEAHNRYRSRFPGDRDFFMSDIYTLQLTAPS